MSDVVKKEEVEELLKRKIADSQFLKALRRAEHKRDCVYQKSKNPAVLQHWYLVKLTEECVRSLALSRFTIDLCRNLRNMEKERPAGSVGAKTRNHIVNVSAGKIK